MGKCIGRREQGELLDLFRGQFGRPGCKLAHNETGRMIFDSSGKHGAERGQIHSLDKYKSERISAPS